MLKNFILSEGVREIYYLCSETTTYIQIGKEIQDDNMVSKTEKCG